MNKLDCTHSTVVALEKELLFNEVMKLRKRVAKAEELLDEIDRDNGVTSLQLNIEINQFLGRKYKGKRE